MATWTDDVRSSSALTNDAKNSTTWTDDGAKIPSVGEFDIGSFDIAAFDITTPTQNSNTAWTDDTKH